jgi:hypothetical protein
MDVMQATPRDPWRSKRHPMRTNVLTCALRSWGVSLCICGCLGAGVLASGCTASAEDVHPPKDQLFFPTGLALSPVVPSSGRVLFVVNSNSELRFDSGSISVIDLDLVQKAIDAWSPIPDPAVCNVSSPPAYCNPDPGTCKPDPDHRETLGCDAVKFLRQDAEVRIGNFATDIAVQDFSYADNNGNKIVKARVVVPTRGDPSIAWADFDGENLSCTAASGSFALCDDAHRLSNVATDPDIRPIPDEPFGVFADPGLPGPDNTYPDGFAVVTHLTTGSVTLINSPGAGIAQVADVRSGLFRIDPTIGQSSATGVAGRPQGGDGEIVYVGSRTDDRIQTFTIARPVNNTPPYLLANDFFFLNAVGTSTGGSTDTRGMQFSQTGDRMYVVNRQPPTLQIFDTSLGPDGFPRNAATGASDICRQASTLAVLDAGAGERAYVTCFADGQIYVVDPNGSSQVEDIITVGRGPYSVVAATYQAKSPPGDPAPITLTRSLLFVSNFLEDTIAVVDVTPTLATRNRVVLRIGQPRAP